MASLSNTLVRLGLATRADVGGATPPSVPEAPPEAYAADVQPPSRSSTSSVVTPRESTALDSMYRALFILDTASVQLSVDAFRNGARLPQRPSILERPDINDHRGGFLSTTVLALACRGNAYWRKHRGADDAVINVTNLNPLLVIPHLDKDGITRFDYQGKTYGPRDISHLRLMALPGEVEGLGPIQAAQRALRGYLDVAGYGSTWFTDAGIPNGTLKTDQNLTAESAKAWKKQWMDSVGGGEPAVLGSGLNYAPLYLKPSEVQWLESQRFGVAGIARLMGMTPRQMLIGIEGNSQTYANQEQEEIAWVRYTLMRYLREIELALSDLLPRGQNARFNIDALLRTDTKTRYEAHEIGIRAGFLSVEQVCAIEGLPVPQPAETKAPADA